MSHPSRVDRYLLAASHVVRGRAIVARQRQLINDIRRLRGDTADAEDLLTRFESTLAIFEDDLRRIEVEGVE